MRRLLALALLLAAAQLPAGAYRWVDDAGRVHYGDRPVAGAQPVPLPAARPAEAAAPPVAAADPGPYEAFEILSPEANATLRDSEGRVPISLLLDPPLMEGHRLRILLNEQPIHGDTPGTHLALEGLPFGSHRLRVEILDPFDVPVASTAPLDLHLRRPVPETAPP